MADSVIAIDGPTASGKSTVAELVADRLDANYISTGNMYRAVTLVALRESVKLEELSEEEIRNFLHSFDIDFTKQDNKLILTINSEPAGQDIRKPEVANYVSIVAKLGAVRKYLVEKQRNLTHLGLLVMEGRDIGTVVFPNAKYKFYLTASPRVRAERRLKQKEENPSDSTIESVAKDIERRDKLDSQRELAPLKKPEDAVLIDSSNLNINEVVDKIVSYIN